MPYKNALLKSLQLQALEDGATPKREPSELSDLMSDADYLRQSSALINEALQKGYDVLQLPNGDIVTTGTKTIVHTYSWDKGDHKLVRTHTQTEDDEAAKKDEFIQEMLD